MRLFILGGMDNHRCHAAEVDLVGLYHADGNARRNPGVDGIAARFKDFKGRVRRQVMPGRRHVARAHNGQTGRGFHREFLNISSKYVEGYE